MLNTYNNHVEYLNNCVKSVLSIIILMPQFNNYDSVAELLDIYFKKYVKTNKYYSKKIADDCYFISELLLDEYYIYDIINEFENIDDAYHYLALITQYKRLCNKYKILTNNFDNGYYNIISVDRCLIEC